MQKRVSNGVFAPLSGATKIELIKAFTNARKFPSLRAIGTHFGISKTTVKNVLLEEVRANNISDKNHLLFRTRQNIVAVAKRRVERKRAMIKFLKSMARREVPVSLNLLQKKFGGEKAFASEVLKEFIASRETNGSAKPVLRRTASNQPKRI
ncbi:MAG: hypothetical protein WCW13_00325 [archaeon]